VKLSNAKMTDKGTIEGGFLSNGPLYTLLAIYMPLSFLIALLLLAGALLSTALPLASIIISSCVSAVLASLYCDFMKDVKSSLVAADIRGAIIILIVFYVLVSVFRRELPFVWRFRPGIVNILSAMGALYTWYSVISLKQLFSARRQFEKYMELYREEQLQSVLREDISLIQYIDEKITKRRFRYVVLLVIVGILTLISVIMKVHLSLSLYLMLIGILVVAVFICGFFEIMLREQHYAVEGIALSAADRLKHTGGIWVLILLCTVCAILAASDTSLLPFTAIASFFAWLLSLFGNLSPNKPTNTLGPESIEPLEMPQPINLPFENADSPLPKWLTEYGPMILKYSLIFLAAAAFVRFMISPLLNRGKPSGEKLKFHERLWHIIAEWFKRMLVVLSSFYAFLKNNKTTRKLNKYNSEEIRRTAATILNAYSQAKKQDMRRSATLFARLIIWGNEVFQLTWKPSYAPGEYCVILAASMAATTATATLDLIGEKVIRCGELFEKALYSAEVLSAAEQREFKNLVEEITSTTGS